MERLLPFMLRYGLWVCAALVVLGAQAAVALSFVVCRLGFVLYLPLWRRLVHRRLGKPDAVAFAPDDDARTVTLAGVHDGEGNLRVGALQIELLGPPAVGAAMRRGDRVIVRGRLRHVVVQEEASYREGSPTRWALEGLVGPLQHATEPHWAPHRVTIFYVALSAMLVTLGGVQHAGRRADERLGPLLELDPVVHPTEITWRLGWVGSIGDDAVIALGSPWHRDRALVLARRMGTTSRISRYDIEALQAHVAAAPQDTAVVYFAAGLPRQVFVPSWTRGYGVDASIGLQSRWMLGLPLHDEHLQPLREQLHSTGSLPLESPALYGLAQIAALGMSGEARSAEALARYHGPAAEALGCIGRVWAHIDTGELPGQDAEAMLRSSSPACRILAATHRTRRDDASLAALNAIEATTPAVWRPLLDAARDLLVLEGHRPGRLRSPPSCAQQQPHGTSDPVALARYPGVADALVEAARGSTCPWMAARVGLSAQEARLRFVLDTNGRCQPTSTPTGPVGFGCLPAAMQDYDFQLRNRARLAREDARFGSAWEVALQEGLQRSRVLTTLLAARVLQRHDPAALVRDIEAGSTSVRPRPGQAYAGITNALGWLSDADETAPQRGSATLLTVNTRALSPAMVQAIAEGPALTARNWVAVLREADPDPAVDALRVRAMPFALRGDTPAVLAALGLPTAHAVRAFADLAPLLLHHREAAVPWLRVGHTFSEPGAMSAYAMLRLLDARGRGLRSVLGEAADIPVAGEFPLYREGAELPTRLAYWFGMVSWLSTHDLHHSVHPEIFLGPVIETLRTEARQRTLGEPPW